MKSIGFGSDNSSVLYETYWFGQWKSIGFGDGNSLVLYGIHWLFGSGNSLVLYEIHGFWQWKPILDLEIIEICSKGPKLCYDNIFSQNGQTNSGGPAFNGVGTFIHSMYYYLQSLQFT